MFYPSDAVATERAVELAANTRGITFIRLGRPATPIFYNNGEKFEIGKAKILRSSNKDQALVIAAGVTLEQAINAAMDLESFSGISVRVLDPFTIKPLDVVGILENAKESGGKILTVEDHYPEVILDHGHIECRRVDVHVASEDHTRLLKGEPVHKYQSFRI